MQEEEIGKCINTVSGGASGLHSQEKCLSAPVTAYIKAVLQANPCLLLLIRLLHSAGLPSNLATPIAAVCQVYNKTTRMAGASATCHFGGATNLA